MSKSMNKAYEFGKHKGVGVYWNKDTDTVELPKAVFEYILSLVPTEQDRPKGHWIMTSDYLTTAYGSIDYVKCSCCGEDSLEEGDFCPNCGAKMVEPQERSGKE